MSDFNRKAMLDQANELGLEFPGNISNVKLQALIIDALAAPLEDEPLTETPPPSPAVKAEEPEESEATLPTAEELTVEQGAVVIDRPLTAAEKHVRLRKRIASQRAKAMKKHIVTITNKDPRENEVTTTAYLGFENQYFGIARLVPLDIPVELEQALILIASNCTMTQHRDEVDQSGRRTGNKVIARVKKYAISYQGEAD